MNIMLEFFMTGASGRAITPATRSSSTGPPPGGAAMQVCMHTKNTTKRMKTMSTTAVKTYIMAINDKCNVR